MLKKIGFWVLIAVFIGLLAYGYFYIVSLKKPRTTAINAIPDNCVFLAETNDFFRLWKKLNETNMIWQELQQLPYFSEIRESAHVADSILFADESSRNILQGNKVYLAAFDTAGTKEYLYALNISLENSEDVLKFIRQIATDPEKVKSAGGEQIWKFGLKTGKGQLFLYEKDGLVLFSKSKNVIENSIACMNKNCIGNDPYFKTVSDIAGNSADFRFYLNLGRTGELYRQYFKRTPLMEALAQKNGDHGWFEADLDFTPNEMKINGFTVPDSTSFLNYLAAQKPVSIEFTDHVPQSTDNFLFIGLSNFPSFYDSVEKKVLLPIERNMHERILHNLSAKAGMDLKSKILGAIGNEIIAMRARFGDSVQYSYCAVNLSDREEEEADFHIISDSIIHAKIKVNENEVSDSLYYFKDPDLIPALTCGIVSGNFHYCFFYEDYLVFCEGKEQWAKYIDEVSKGKVLSKNEDFERFRSGNVSDECNLFLYSSFSTSADFIPGFLAGDLKSEVEKHSDLLNKFHSGGVQFSAYRNLLLTQGYLLYSPVFHRSNQTVWEVKLDSFAVMPPAIVLNHKTGLEEIFIQDAADNIYLLSNTGKILWKRRVDGRIMSRIHQVDYFQNNKLQYLFNTGSTIYMIDRNGNYVEGYPLKLEVPASNGISVFDYEKNRDYRIVYFSEDFNIHILKTNGKPVDGFSFGGAEDTVRVPVIWERINFKDYLIFTDVAGNFYGLGRKGEKRLSISEKVFVNGSKFVIEFGKDIDKTKVCFYSHEEKKIKQVYLDNKKKETTVATEMVHPAAYFLKINDDEYNDLVLIEGSRVEVYDDQGNLLQKLEWKEGLRPQFRQLNKNGEILYAFTDVKDNLLLIPVSWQPADEPSVKSTYLPAIEMLNDDGYYFLVGVHDDLVSCYPF